MGRTRLVIAITIALLAAACTPAATQPGASPGAPAAATADSRRVELTFTNWFYQGDMKGIYDAFIAEHLKTEQRISKVVVETQPFVRYHDVLNVKLAGGNPPDIAWIHASLQSAYIDAGRLVDLRPYLDQIPGFDLSDYTPASLAPWTRGNKLYALPFTNATNVVFYNVDIFQKAGLKTPEQMERDGEWTWANLRTVAKKLVDSKAARFGFVLQNNIYTNGWRNLVEVWGPYGGGPWSEDGKTCRFNAPETVEGTKLIHDMIFVDKSHPGPGVDVTFATGDVGMSLTRPNFAGQWSDGKFKWAVVRQPDGPKGFVPSFAQNGIAVLSNTKSADLAAKFIAYTQTRDNAIRFQVNTPSNRKSTFTADILAKAVPQLSKEQMNATVIRALNSPKWVMEYAHKNFGPLFSNSHPIFDGQMWKAGVDVKAVSDRACDAVKGLLD